RRKMGNLMEGLRSVAATLPFGLVAFIVTVAAGELLRRQGGRLATPGAPSGILSLELAWRRRAAEKIIKSWKPDKLAIAKQQVLIDFVFIAGYACFLLFVGLAVAERAQAHGLGALAPMAQWAGCGGFAAGLLDCLENFGLLAMLRRGPTDWLALSTSAF